MEHDFYLFQIEVNLSETWALTGMSQELIITDRALHKMKEKVAKDSNGESAWRLTLIRTPCMRGRGYSYGFMLGTPNKDDFLSMQSDGIRVYISKSELPLLRGVKIDFVETFQEDSFKFSNPNAIGKCHCSRHDIFKTDAIS